MIMAKRSGFSWKSFQPSSPLVAIFDIKGVAKIFFEILDRLRLVIDVENGKLFVVVGRIHKTIQDVCLGKVRINRQKLVFFGIDFNRPFVLLDNPMADVKTKPHLQHQPFWW